MGNNPIHESGFPQGPCPVCLYTDWEIEYDFSAGDEIEVIRCQSCQWPPAAPHTVEEWRRQHFISPYLKDLEAMVARRNEAIRELLGWLGVADSAMGDADWRNRQVAIEKAEALDTSYTGKEPQ